MYAVADLKLRGIGDGSSRFFLDRGLLSACARELLAKRSALLLELSHRCARSGKLVDLPDRGVSKFLSLTEDLLGFFACVFYDLFSGGVELFILLLEPLLESFGLAECFGGSFVLLFVLETARRKSFDNVVETLLFLGHVPACTFYQLFGKAELARDRKSVASSGYSDQEPVGGRKRCHIELTAGVADTGCGECVGLELSVMSGCHNVHPSFMQIREDRPRESRALRGIRSGSELVEEHKRTLVRIFEDRDDVLHV